MWQPRDDQPTAERQVQALLQRTAARLRVKHALIVAAVVSVVATVTLLSGFATIAWPWMALLLSVAGVVALQTAWRIGRNAGSVEAAARAWERTYPDSRNVVVTANELRALLIRTDAWIRARVFADALDLMSAGDVGQVVPLRSAAAACAGALGLCALALLYGPRLADHIRPVVPVGRQTEAVPSVSGSGEVHATITPPPYVGGPVQSFENPPRLEAIQGSRVRLTLRPRNATWQVRFGSQTLPLVADRDAVHADLTLDESGYFVIDSGVASDKRLLPVLVTPDRAPVVRIDTPGKDLLVADTARSIRVAAAANDDHGLTALEIRYTKVSGSGEQFAFEEGTLPVEVYRQSSREWAASGVLSLARLGLGPRDALVYRAVGRDARPGDAGLASSDTFLVEIAGPGQVAIEGFELPPDRERYALSQQMIVLKIERLRAREKSLARSALASETGAIAGEQRAVRSNFVFLLGGHVEDEVEEAEHEHEIQEGRLENTARREINQAIQDMSRAEQALVAVSTLRALTDARAAVQALQRAFGRNRYILRTLPVRSRLDLSRRLAGDLGAAADWQRVGPAAEPDRRALAARAMLAGLLTLAPAVRSHANHSRQVLTGLAEEALQVAPGDEGWQRISTAFLQLRDTVAGGKAEATESAFADLLTLVIAEATRAATFPAPRGPEDATLRSAWVEERRRR